MKRFLIGLFALVSLIGVASVLLATPASARIIYIPVPPRIVLPRIIIVTPPRYPPPIVIKIPPLPAPVYRYPWFPYRGPEIWHYYGGRWYTPPRGHYVWMRVNYRSYAWVWRPW